MARRPIVEVSLGVGLQTLRDDLARRIEESRLEGASDFPGLYELVSEVTIADRPRGRKSRPNQYSFNGPGGEGPSRPVGTVHPGLRLVRKWDGWSDQLFRMACLLTGRAAVPIPGYPRNCLGIWLTEAEAELVDTTEELLRKIGSGPLEEQLRLLDDLGQSMPPASVDCLRAEARRRAEPNAPGPSHLRSLGWRDEHDSCDVILDHIQTVYDRALFRFTDEQRQELLRLLPCPLRVEVVPDHLETRTALEARARGKYFLTNPGVFDSPWKSPRENRPPETELFSLFQPGRGMGNRPCRA